MYISSCAGVISSFVEVDSLIEDLRLDVVIRCLRSGTAEFSQPAHTLRAAPARPRHGRGSVPRPIGGPGWSRRSIRTPAPVPSIAPAAAQRPEDRGGRLSAKPGCRDERGARTAVTTTSSVRGRDMFGMNFLWGRLIQAGKLPGRSTTDDGTRNVMCSSFDLRHKARRFRIGRPSDDGTSGRGRHLGIAISRLT
jgi:hypothetical protein